MRPNSNSQTLITLLALAALLGMSLPAAGAGRRDPDGTIFLGGIFNLTGDQAVLDLPSALGAQLVVDQVNHQGGLLGRWVELIIEDGKLYLTDQFVPASVPTP